MGSMVSHMLNSCGAMQAPPRSASYAAVASQANRTAANETITTAGLHWTSLMASISASTRPRRSSWK